MRASRSLPPSLQLSYSMYAANKNKRKGVRKSSVAKKARYAPRTTSANRSLILENAATIRRMKALLPSPVYTDYQFTGAEAPFLNAPNIFFTLQAVPLTRPSLWNPCMRQDINVEDSAATVLKRMQLWLRMQLGEANWCQISTFVVSLRKDAADTDVNNLVDNQDYVLSGEGFNPILNSAVFKVHFAKHCSLMTSAWKEEKAVQGNAELIGNPKTTLEKAFVDLKPGFKLRQPTGVKWRLMDETQLSPHERMYLLMFFKGQTNDVDDNPPRVDWNAVYTCFNAS